MLNSLFLRPVQQFLSKHVTAPSVFYQRMDPLENPSPRNFAETLKNYFCLSEE